MPYKCGESWIVKLSTVLAGVPGTRWKLGLSVLHCDA
ncbi:MAG: hypothetical protein ACJAYU_002478 [Bradymonadia bacterium]|jgi:hypothetical protein